MKQKNLVKKMYQACLDHNVDLQRELRLKEYAKIFKRKESGKHFNSKWTVLR
jgi:hypothetical protein